MTVVVAILVLIGRDLVVVGRVPRSRATIAEPASTTAILDTPMTPGHRSESR
jgi:hypothetical protein